MKYKFLNEWKPREVIGREITSITRFQDQYFLLFYKTKTKLQISLNQGNAFIFETKNDILPTQKDGSVNLFFQLLNKAKLSSIEIDDSDRIMYLSFEKKNIYNEVKRYRLIIELAAGFENIVLCQLDNGKAIIYEALRKFSFAENAQRQILPKMEWAAPQTNFVVDDSEIKYPLGIAKNKVYEAAETGYSDINSLFEALYYEAIFHKKLTDLRKNLAATAKNEIKKCKRKLAKQLKEMDSATAEQEWLQKAELCKANMHMIKNGMSEITVKNYYSPDFSDLTIPLKADKSPLENVNFYFKKYKKAKNGKVIIEQQIGKTNVEMEQLNANLEEILNEDDYFELVKLNKANKQQKRLQEAKVYFRRIKIDQNWEIFIGRSSKENDLLTTKVAKGRDWWFHTRVFQGTHVVLRNYTNKQLPDKYRLICASLAAYYSKAKKSENVPVDYTQIRFVRKPHGAVPGYVTYTNQKTVYVNPIDHREAMRILGISN